MNIGFDLDGVIACRPRIFKLNHVKGKYQVKMSVIEQWFWKGVMYLRQPSKIMRTELERFTRDGEKLYLITGRLSFLRDLTDKWLDRHCLRKFFDGVEINIENRQPHEFKADKIKRFKISRFYEDELFTAEHLKNKTGIKVMWVVANGEQVHELK